MIVKSILLYGSLILIVNIAPTTPALVAFRPAFPFEAFYLMSELMVAESLNFIVVMLCQIR